MASSSSSSSSPPLAHRLIQKYFPDPSLLLPLHTFLSPPYSSPSPIPLSNPSSDPQQYLSLLNNAFIAIRRPHPDSDNHSKPLQLDSGCDGISMFDVIERVHAKLLKRGNKKAQAQSKYYQQDPTFKNILTLGYRLGDSTNSLGKPGISNFFPNTNVSYLQKSKDFALLLERIGPSALIQILSDTRISLFLPLENNCYVQISGPPLSEFPLPKDHALGGIGFGPNSNPNWKNKNNKDQDQTVQEAERGVGSGSSRKDRLNVEHRSSSKKFQQNTSTTKKRKFEEIDRSASTGGSQTESRTPSDIIFPRSEIFHARPMIDQHGKIVLGLSPKHILNRLLDLFGPMSERTRHFSKYIFPREYNHATRPTTSTYKGTKRINQNQNPSKPLLPNDQDRDPPSSKLGGLTTSRSFPQPQVSSNLVPSKINNNNNTTGSKSLPPSRQGSFNNHNPSRGATGQVVNGPSSSSSIQGPTPGLRFVKGRLLGNAPSRKPTTTTLSTTATSNAAIPAGTLNPQSHNNNNNNPLKRNDSSSTTVVATSTLVSASKSRLQLHTPFSFGVKLQDNECGNRMGEDDIKRFGPIKTPKQLRNALPLLQTMMERHNKCNYQSILGRYCKSRLTKKEWDMTEADRTVLLDMIAEPKTQCSPSDFSLEISHASLLAHHKSVGEEYQVQEEEQTPPKITSSNPKPSFLELTCSPHEIDRFLETVLRQVVPLELWGTEKNFQHFLTQLSLFIRLRRYESFNIHHLLQGFSLLSCDWIDVSNNNQIRKKQKVKREEMLRRREVLEEWLWWVLESFVMNILKTTFYITESSATRNRVLYFRQDDWHTLCKPLLDMMASTLFKSISTNEAKHVLSARKLGFSYIRLLPKETGVRPIVNLRRRALISTEAKDGWKGKRSTERKELGPSINYILQNAFQILSYERMKNPDLLGASVLGPNEIYQKLKQFKSNLRGRPQQRQWNNNKLPKLYFVKVDVKSCFDSIEQDKLLSIIEDIFSEDGYMLQKYGQVHPTAGRVQRKFNRKAGPEYEHPNFPEFAAAMANSLRHAIFVDSVVYPFEGREEILKLLREHILENIVKIGGKFYRQVVGIPQGSVLSTLLCSFFYGDLERKSLKFTQDPGNLLLRYIDDFLFITTNKQVATKFLKIMHKGHPDYGCFISLEKTLTNFPISVGESGYLPQVGTTNEFPWCGLSIDTRTLDVQADYSRYEKIHMGDTLTLDLTRHQGRAFLHKMLQAMKARSHIIYNDTSSMDITTVYLNIYQNFMIAAVKFCSYIRAWKTDPRKNQRFFLGVIDQCVHFAFVAVKNRSRTSVAKECEAGCNVRASWITWLGKHAFCRVLRRKPTIYIPLIKSLEKSMAQSKHRNLPIRFRCVIWATSSKALDSILF